MTSTTTTESTTGEPAVVVRRFEEMNLSEPVLRAIRAMGWSEPTPVQLDSHPPAAAGRDLIVQSRTGTGKTAAFGLPIVDKLLDVNGGFQALILAPTRELALQSSTEIGKLGAYTGLRTAAVYGGASMEKQIKELSEGAQIVSGTPGRVLDHLRRGTLDPRSLRVLVLDEADEMLSMGFAKELNAIMERLPQTRQTLLFSATVDGPIKRMADRHMTDPEYIALSGDAVGALGVSHFMYFVSGMNRAADLVRIVEVENPESAIVFCNTKAETEQVAGALQSAGYNADWLNGDLPQNDREKVMSRTRKGELRFLVATDVAARGIDVSHLTHVINFSLPNQLEQYIHRTGRTGRAGRTGTAIALVSPQEIGTLYYLRLQYKIFPVERSLPSQVEDRTRTELDRLAMVEASFPHEPEDRVTVAVARRLLTHPDSERLVAGLLGRFFAELSGPDLDARAATERREKAPTVVEEPATPEAAASEQAEPESEGITLYVNIGRKDDARPSDLRDFFTRACGLDNSEVHRIRVRDRHCFVDVAPERADAVVEALKAAQWNGREVLAEVARGQR